MKAIGFLIITALFLLVGLRAGNALLIHENAQVAVTKQMCPVLEGNESNGVCLVRADLSHSFLSGDPILRLKNGAVFELQSADVLMYSYEQSHYGFL